MIRAYAHEKSAKDTKITKNQDGFVPFVSLRVLSGSLRLKSVNETAHSRIYASSEAWKPNSAPQGHGSRPM